MACSFGVDVYPTLCTLLLLSLSHTNGQCNQNQDGICHIDGSLSTAGPLQCGGTKCIISCPSYGSCGDKQIICPYDAEYCIINCHAVNLKKNKFLITH